jgi:hypothetical protein
MPNNLVDRRSEATTRSQRLPIFEIPLVGIDVLVSVGIYFMPDHGSQEPLQGVGIPCFAAGLPNKTSTESLILAQDERWRRA